MVCGPAALTYNADPAFYRPPLVFPMPASPLEVCLEAAALGGKALLHWRDRFQAREKGPRDLVSQADLAAQEAIRDVLCKAFPDHDFLSEEDVADRRASGQLPIPPRQSAWRWI